MPTLWESACMQTGWVDALIAVLRALCGYIQEWQVSPYGRQISVAFHRRGRIKAVLKCLLETLDWAASTSGDLSTFPSDWVISARNVLQDFWLW